MPNGYLDLMKTAHDLHNTTQQELSLNPKLIGVSYMETSAPFLQNSTRYPLFMQILFQSSDLQIQLLKVFSQCQGAGEFKTTSTSSCLFRLPWQPNCVNDAFEAYVTVKFMFELLKCISSNQWLEGLCFANCMLPGSKINMILSHVLYSAEICTCTYQS